MKYQLPGVDSRYVEQRTNQLEQVLSRRPNQLQLMRDRSVRDLPLNEFSEPKNAMQWCAELVTHASQK